ncbi:hypothetical protein M409DRAFT_48961 [Zasmidium cellare ATCC 36951]|uniref:Nephrocystin 3-like N-terminal domain-containing protein n=1 Tax=Zasmidium cellare ATCC 36951 TaxID=1080233 RepID=A0A6A6D4N0_ZASCE|nr:uncharacterized protein M409DRAFT_48961 [Zasmidium cellare ATCC 36951]KAF2174083.1 hypothetical protein M409DRAFT_48961 [Zasmidium cellare ATCC 36951]
MAGFKAVANVVLFNDDGDVSRDMLEMERFVCEVTQSQVDVILKDVKGLAKFMSASEHERQRNMTEIVDHLGSIGGAVGKVQDSTQQIKKAQDLQVSRQEHEAHLKSIRRALGVGDDDPWLEKQNSLIRSRVPDSGSWLVRDNIVFKQWADLSRQGTNVMALTGRSGYGKSHICSTVIAALLEKYGKTSAQHKAIVSYYYFSPENRDESLEKCLGSLICQIASKRPTYARAVATACENAGTTYESQAIWDKLIFDLLDEIHGDCFICLDGFQDFRRVDCSGKTISSMAKYAALPRGDGFQMLFFVSALPDHFESMELGDGFAQISLGLERSYSGAATGKPRKFHWNDNATAVVNQQDLVLVARHRIQGMYTRKPELHVLLEDMGDVASELAAAVAGHFENLEDKLRQIDSCESEEQIRSIIENADEGLSTSLRTAIADLNASLGQTEIKQLNELLLWAAGGFEPHPSLMLKPADVLQAALYFRLGQKYMLKAVVDKFPALITMDDISGVKLQSETLKEILEEVPTPTDATSMDQSNTVLHASEIALVRRFLLNVCDDDLYSRFEFDRFFEAKTGKQTARICLGGRNAFHLSLLQICLDSLCTRHKDMGIEALRHYAATHFHRHLREVDLLEMKTGDNVDLLRRCLSNPYVEVGYRDHAEQHEFIKAALAQSSDRYNIVSKVAGRVAALWFGNERSMGLLFIVPAKIMAKDLDLHVDISPGYDGRPSGHDIDRVVEWAKKKVDLDLTDEEWELQRARTYKHWGLMDEALRMLEKLEPQISDNWLYLRLMGEAHTHPQKRLDYLKMFRALKDQLLNTDARYTLAYWGSLYDEADILFRLGDLESAASCFQALVEHDVGEDEFLKMSQESAVNYLFYTWCEQKAFHKVIDMLAQWEAMGNGPRGVRYWLPAMVDSFYSLAIRAAAETGSEQHVIQMFSSAAGLPLHEQHISVLRYASGALLYHTSQRTEDHESAIEIWEELVTSPREFLTLAMAGWYALRSLCQALLEDAAPVGGEAERARAGMYEKKLENMTHIVGHDIDSLRREDHDIRLAVARAKHLRGDRSAARKIIQSRLGDVLEDEFSSIGNRFLQVAASLAAIDDDAGALLGCKPCRKIIS